MMNNNINLQELVQNILEEEVLQPAKVSRIRVTGAHKTREWIFDKNLRDILDAKTLGEVMELATLGSGKLNMLGVFKTVLPLVTIDENEENGYEVEFAVEEKRLITGEVGASFDRVELQGNATMNMNSVLGIADKLQWTSTGSHVGNTMHDLRYTFPMNGYAWQPFSVYGYQSTTQASTLGINQTDRVTGVQQNFLSSLGKHTIKLESKWQHISPKPTKGGVEPAFSTRMECGHFLNNALTHVLTSRVKTGNVTTNVELTSQVAGFRLGGSFHYLKNHVHATMTYSMLRSWGMQFKLGGKMGVITPFSQLPKGFRDVVPSNATHTAPALPDRFFLGGPWDVRGFRTHSIGPMEEGYARGGVVFWALAAHAYAVPPFGPWKERFGDLFKLHAWVNAGNLTNVHFRFNADYLEQLIVQANVACGVGLAIQLGPSADIELNFSVPLLVAEATPTPGLSFSIGVNML